MTVILGLNGFHPGSSAALVVDGRPVAAIAEERLSRRKYDHRFPKLAIRRCLEMAGLEFADLDAVAVGRDSSSNRRQKMEYVLRNPTRLLNFVRIKTMRAQVDDLKTLLSRECEVDPGQLRFTEHHVEHHLAHVASAFFMSPWERAAGFSADGSGDFVTVMMAACEGNTIDVRHRVHVPHSLGSFYTMICQFIGYRKYGDEGKVMGLAPYGRDTYHDELARILTVDGPRLTLGAKHFMPFGSDQGVQTPDDGEIELRRHYSDHMISLFGEPREPYGDLTDRDRDLAFGAQHRFEEAYFKLLNALHGLCPEDRIAMAGGCVLNSVANGKMFDRTPFTETSIHPAAGDDGLALGAALYVARTAYGAEPWVMTDSYLGPEFDDAAIRAALDRAGVRYERHEREPLLEATVAEMVRGNVVGWFQGRMEWGPRALGNRSIVVHPGLPDMKDVLNARIKRREPFRPFAPSVLVDRQAEIFEHTHPSPFMLHVYGIRPAWRERLCAVNHFDDTGRLQTVSREENPLYYDLIRTFDKHTGIPVVLNTSFNENEPIVCEPAEAIDCFLRTKMDVLVIGAFVCRKTDQGTARVSESRSVGEPAVS